MSLALRILTAFTLLGLLASQLDLSHSFELIENVDLIWLLAAFSLLLVLRVLAAIRWHAVLQHHDHQVSLLEIVEITFVSASIGHLLPSGVGGDVARGVQLSHRHGRAASTASTILIDRIVGVFSMLLVALLGSVIAFEVVGALNLFWPLLLLNILFVVLWLASNALHSILSSLSLNVSGKVRRFYASALSILKTLSDRQHLSALLPKILGLSLLTQLIRCAMFYFLYLAFSVELSFLVFIAFIPIVFVVMQLPISIGGLGVREGALIYFFSLLSVPAEISVNVGIVSHVLQIMVALPGFLLWAHSRRQG